MKEQTVEKVKRKVKRKVTRKEKREALENFKLSLELKKILNHFFPDLIQLLKQVQDPRHQSYISYENHVLLFTRILGAVFQIGSMRGVTESLNRTTCINNMSWMLDLGVDLTELPYWETINNYLKKFDPEELEQVISKLVYRLTRMRSFENSRIRDKYWHVLVDATHLYTFEERHCEHCLVREFKDKVTKEVLRREYYHVVLEAKLVILGNVVISIATEFVENESSDVSKQDCEIKAFYRLAKKLKKQFPRLPICLGLDSLYAAGPVFDLCKEYNWRYIIRFKEGSIKSLAEEFHALKDIEPDQTWERNEKGISKVYKYVLKIPYQAHELNIVEYNQSDMEYPFVFITDLPISRRNCEQLVIDGRCRWKIENEGFNEQKNGGFGLEHMFCEDYNAIKNHYFLIQIGHMISQLLECGFKRLTALSQISTRQLMADVKESFRTVLLDYMDKEKAKQRCQYRFE
jgi:hypothetical protein